MSVGQLVTAVTGGASVLVTGSAGAAPLLAALAQLLVRTGSRTRVLHVRPPLDLQGFMGQVARADGAPGSAQLEQGFDALTVPGAGCDRIALLVEDADRMPRETLRYVELALGVEPCLQVVLAGQSGITDMLALEGFAGLRRRIALHIALPDAEPSPVARPAPARPAGVALLGPPVLAETPSRPYGKAPSRLLAGAALAACLGLVAGVSLLRPAPGGGVTLARLALPTLPDPIGPTAGRAVTDAAPLAPLLRPEAAVGRLPAEADHPSGFLASARSAPVAGPGPASPPEAAAPEPAAAATVPDHLFNPVPQPDPAPSSAATLSAPVLATPADGLPAAAEPALALDAGLPPSVPVATADDAPVEPDPTLPARQPSAGPIPAAPGRAATLPASPVPHRAPPRAITARPERVADGSPAPAQDAQRCRNILLHAQLGEVLNDGERTYLRNGCR